MIKTEMTYRQRLNLWLNERFPPINFVSGIFMYLLAKSVAGPRTSIGTNEWLIDVLAALIPMMHLFLLRVFDEHKDFESDRVNYPERILQKGIFKLSEVRRLGYLAFAIENFAFLMLLVFNQMETRLLWFYGILWVWTFLMAKEFFVKEWLKKHFLVYGVTHLFITPILFLMCIGFANPDFVWNDVVFLAICLSLLTGWLYEVTRKTKASEEEKKHDQSYSQLFGVGRAIQVIVVSLVLTHVFIWQMFRGLGIPIWVYLFLGIPILMLSIHALFRFRESPSIERRKKNEKLVALATLFAYLTPIVYWIAQ